MLKVGIVSAYNPHTDKKAHSGILAKINEAIENAGCETVWIKNPSSLGYSILGKLAKLCNMFFKKNISIDRTYLGAYLQASTIDKKIVDQVDYIMVIHHFYIAYWLKTNKPIIYHSDATFEIIDEYYIHNLWDWNKRQAENIEVGALKNASLHLSSSNWRNDSVINHYKINPSKCRVLEYGPCLDIANTTKIKEKSSVLQLLFFGVEWGRKGGDIAVETCRLLNEKGVNAVLTIVGIKQLPESCIGKDYINFIGYLNKNDNQQYKKLQSILATTDIMLLPTMAECAGIVFSESAAYGIPVITYDTGGVGNYVINDLNGYRLPLESGSTEFAEKIVEMIKGNILEKLSEGGLEIASTRLNWTNWTKEFSEYFNERIK